MESPTSGNYGHVLILADIIDTHETIVIFEQKRMNQGYRLAGGKIEPSETCEEAAAKEFTEETGIPVTADEIEYIYTKEIPSNQGGTFQSHLMVVKLTSDRLPKEKSWKVPDEEGITAYVKAQSIFFSTDFYWRHRERIARARSIKPNLLGGRV